MKHTQSRLYRIWAGIKRRCRTPSASGYHRYGMRGIDICEEWADDFMAFARWAKQTGYNDRLSIDRINGRCDYEPANCRWVDHMAQANNMVTNKWVTWCGVRKTLAEWSRDPRCVVSLKLLYMRMARGWPFSEALTIPPLPPGKKRASLS